MSGVLFAYFLVAGSVAVYARGRAAARGDRVPPTAAVLLAAALLAAGVFVLAAETAHAIALTRDLPEPTTRSACP